MKPNYVQVNQLIFISKILKTALAMLVISIFTTELILCYFTKVGCL